jgi:type I restriction enzyme S subunit
VSLVNELLSKCIELEREITGQIRVSRALRQSILKSAFSGQLTPQDPTDEPASVLLERITVERNQQKTKAAPKTARRKKVTA